MVILDDLRILFLVLMFVFFNCMMSGILRLICLVAATMSAAMTSYFMMSLKMFIKMV